MSVKANNGSLYSTVVSYDGSYIIIAAATIIPTITATPIITRALLALFSHSGITSG